MPRNKFSARKYPCKHHIDAIMTTMASQITSLTVVYSTVYSDADQRKHQSFASLPSVWGIHRDRWFTHTKGQLRGKCFHLMTSSWNIMKLFSNEYWKWSTPHKSVIFFNSRVSYYLSSARSISRHVVPKYVEYVGDKWYSNITLEMKIFVIQSWTMKINLVCVVSVYTLAIFTIA